MSQRMPFMLNALMSGTSGGLLLLVPETVGAWLGWQMPLVYQIVGAGLLLFAASLLWIAGDVEARRPAARAASLADFAWVGLTPVVCWLLWPQLTVLGVAMLVAVAVLVELLGSWQWWVTRRA